MHHVKRLYLFNTHCMLCSFQTKFMKVYLKLSALLKRRVIWETFLGSGRLDDNAMLQAVESKYNTFVKNLEKIDRLTDIISNALHSPESYE